MKWNKTYRTDKTYKKPGERRLNPGVARHPFYEACILAWRGEGFSCAWGFSAPKATAEPRSERPAKFCRSIVMTFSWETFPKFFWEALTHPLPQVVLTWAPMPLWLFDDAEGVVIDKLVLAGI